MSTLCAAGDVCASEDDDWDVNEKLSVPYKRGFKITAMRHQPAEPFGIGYDTPMPSKHAGWKELSQVEYCILARLWKVGLTPVFGSV
jgi:hypothetical protein